MNATTARLMQIGALDESQLNILHKRESTPKQTKEQAGRSPNYLDEFCRCVVGKENHWCHRLRVPYEIQHMFGLREMKKHYGCPDKSECLERWMEDVERQIVVNKLFKKETEEAPDYIAMQHALDWMTWEAIQAGKVNFYFSKPSDDIKERLAS